MFLYGCIGIGNMGGAVAQALAAAAGGSHLIVSSRTREKAEAVAARLGRTAGDNREVAAQCQYLLPGGQAPDPTGRAGGARPDPPVPGNPLRAGLHGGRGLPGPAAKPGRGLPCGADHAQHACLRRGRYGALHPRRWGHSGAGGPASRRSGPRRSSWTGCQNPCWTPPAPWQAAAPAFVCQFLEALADGGVACGLPRENAYRYGAQMLLGTASLLLATGNHPGQLKDAVCSPGGTTIQGVRVLEERGARGAVMDAVLAAFEKNNALSAPH